MFTKQRSAFLLGLAVAILLVGLSACGGQSASSPSSANTTPDQVQIAIHTIDSSGSEAGKPVVILTDPSRVQQLYAALVSLIPLPQDSVCTLEIGPSYTLTFQQEGKTLTIATAQHYGCGRVSIAGEKQDRQAKQDFWPQLDQAIALATPAATPK